MSIEPEGDRTKKALRWISECLKEDPSRAVVLLINDAALKFNLTPKETEDLTDFYRLGNRDDGD